MRRVLLVITFGFVAAGLIGCAGSSPSSASNPASASATVGKPGKGTTAAPPPPPPLPGR